MSFCVGQKVICENNSWGQVDYLEIGKEYEISAIYTDKKDLVGLSGINYADGLVNVSGEKYIPFFNWRFKAAPMSIEPHMLTSSVLELCKTIREDNAWDKLPILADALEDAGLDDGMIIPHFRNYLKFHPTPWTGCDIFNWFCHDMEKVLHGGSVSHR